MSKNNKILNVLKILYEEGTLPESAEQSSYSDIAKQCGVSHVFVSKLVSKLKELNIMSTKGITRSLRYKWIHEVTPNESLAIRLGQVQVIDRKLTEFDDSELIKELKNRGYVIYKEC